MMQLLKTLMPGERPPTDPATASYLRDILKQYNVEEGIVGLRGYYNPGKNQRGIYDDAIFIVTRHRVIGFNANTDPASFKKGIANLIPGQWKYEIGIHGKSKPKFLQYKALTQAAKVIVKRDQTGLDSGLFGINIHKGGYNSVSSIGCQTIHPGQWKEFMKEVEVLMASRQMKTITYALKEV